MLSSSLVPSLKYISDSDITTTDSTVSVFVSPLVVLRKYVSQFVDLCPNYKDRDIEGRALAHSVMLIDGVFIITNYAGVVRGKIHFGSPDDNGRVDISVVVADVHTQFDRQGISINDIDKTLDHLGQIFHQAILVGVLNIS